MPHTTAAEVFPPGEFLREELEARGWTQADLAEILGRPPRLVSEIISGKRSITPETAKGLAEALGTSPQFWMNLESAYQLSRVRQEDSGVAKRARLFEKAPIKEMVRRHWIEGSNNPEVLESRILEFYGINSLESEPVIWAHAARKSASYEHVTPAQWAWLCRARQLAKAIAAPPYSESRFDGLIGQLRLLLASPEDARRAPRILADYGIRLVVVEPLAGTKIDGACFWLDAKAPVVVVSIRFDRIDAFWFTLFHELGHVKAKDGLKNNALPLDIELVGQGATKAEEKPETEQKADSFAMNCIIDKGKIDGFIARIRPLYYKEKIKGFATVNHVHPGLVVGQLQHRGEISYAHNRDMLAKVRDVVTRSAITDGWGSMPAVR